MGRLGSLLGGPGRSWAVLGGLAAVLGRTWVVLGRPLGSKMLIVLLLFNLCVKHTDKKQSFESRLERILDDLEVFLGGLGAVLGRSWSPLTLPAVS